MIKISVKKFLKKNFPNIFEILRIYWIHIIKKKI